MTPGRWRPDWVAGGPGFCARVLARSDAFRRPPPDRIPSGFVVPRRFLGSGARSRAPGLGPGLDSGVEFATRPATGRKAFARPRMGFRKQRERACDPINVLGPRRRKWQAPLEKIAHCRQFSHARAVTGQQLPGARSGASDRIPDRPSPGGRADGPSRPVVPRRGMGSRGLPRRHRYSRVSSRAITTRWIWLVPS